MRNGRRIGLAILLLVAAAGLAAGGWWWHATWKPNVLLIVVDTLRPDWLSCYGMDRYRTPHLDALAERGAVFLDAEAQYPATMSSHATLFTSSYPYIHGVWDNADKLSEDARTIAEVFAAEGWRTAAFVSNEVLHRQTGIAQGFEVFDDRMPDPNPNRPVSERLAAHTTDDALAWVKDVRGRFFLWVHYNDPHGPYTPPPLYRGRARFETGKVLPVSEDENPLNAIPAYQSTDGSGAVDDYLARYAGEILYLDDEVGRFLAGLKRLGVLRRTLVVFTADHGEALGEHDQYFQHASSLYREQLAVPLIFAGPGIPKGRRVSTLVQLVDVMPTILELAKAREHPLMQGHSLVKLMHGRDPDRPPVSYAELFTIESFRHGRWKVVAGEGRPAELYDLSRDPGETRDLAAAEPARAATLLDTMVRFRNGLVSLPTLPTERMADAETVERLRALGYAR